MPHVHVKQKPADASTNGALPRMCHKGDHATGRTYCGLVVEPHQHTPEECDQQGHAQCVVCWDISESRWRS